MSGKKSTKSSISRPRKKSKSRKPSKKSKKKSTSKNKVTSPAARVPASATVETILIAPSDYVPVFHREMNEVKVAEGPSQGATMANAVSECENEASMISKDTKVAKSKKSSARSKSKKGQRSGSKKSKGSSRRKSKSTRTKNKSIKKDLLSPQLPKLADYVVEAINARIDNFAKRFDHNCIKKCPCSKGKKGRKSKKKSRVAS